MGENDFLKEMMTDAGQLKREATKRRSPYQEVSVHKADVDEYLSRGWHIGREQKRTTVMRREWPHDQALENRVWTLFHLLGYPEISPCRSFKILIERQGGGSQWKQIDVLAKDDETVVVAECKSCEKPAKRSLQKDIEEFANLKGPMASAINKHYGAGKKLKIIWMFVTHNIRWSEPDKQRAAGENIKIVTDRELLYYLEVAKHLRAAGRFQFLAEFLQNQKIPEMENIKVPAVRGKLAGRPFYSFVSTPRQMLKIAFVNHRTLNDPDGAPTYQRLVSGTRLRQIGNFLKRGGFFPTNILVNFTEKCRFEQTAHDSETDVAFGHLYLPSKYRSAWVIDGQHRLYAYAPLGERELNQNVMVVAFEQLDKTEEANLFVTINHEQKSVSKNLLDDLEGELKWGSKRPSERIGAIAARLIGKLNNDIGEPIEGRVTQPGITPTQRTCLTVPELKAGLRRSGLLGISAMRGKEYQPGPLSGLTDSETLDRARRVLNAYLEQIAVANGDLWEMGRSGLLCTNTSLQAYFQLLGSLIAYAEQRDALNFRELDPLAVVESVQPYLEVVLEWLRKAGPAEMNREFKVQFGSGGPREYHFRLCRLVNAAFPDFVPHEFEDWMESQSEERIADTDARLKELAVRVQKVIFDTFKAKYGEEDYWDRGVLDKEIIKKAFAKQIEYEPRDRLPLEDYLDFIEYKKIVENKEHWALFEPVFNIPEQGEKGRAKNLKWMERINELRRIPAHATERRTYKVEDFEYIQYVFQEFMARLETQVSVANETNAA